ncbi:hypothetical protein PSN45_002334 [Yamadazyma tenuis]|uniref:Aminopeptidase n=1 Tax=Candida tenuis (strain ATCC 10573 / BCRC 21748 / CBS 615 / JCM 9827 / NBRC 10315 / NRRL Y-1498 / VKM Y-70) TaxID=590646 RepID=G3BEP2_CANTC|nr:uncharacterized protein CANTEDRAFT_109952 [Yamadazyma tenuis ATCC 10573]EGV59941.1 hypothetical protein CANTEDRAFT_109952 [Yamadazyma tenuis ATCC 10573]WEJ94834.1 hypothetical protein PSN45_002334 [Yamadazyma tenuis]
MSSPKPYYDALPSAFVPTHYDVAVYDIDTEANTFSGTVKIVLDVKDATDELSLNYRSLVVKAENVLIEVPGSQETIIRAVSVTEFAKKDFFVIKLDTTIDPIKIPQIVATIKYDAFIQTNMTGFYRSEYTEGDVKKVMLSTQFEAPDARRTFPCFDEPALKATYSVSVTITKQWTVLSNMPVATVSDAGDGLATHLFQKTPRISSYLVAWACGDFEYVESFTQEKYLDDKPLPVRIYTTPGYSKNAQFALEIAPKVIDYFSRVFEVKYPLPKMDLLTVHSFSHNAMENWGLITYRSNALLFDEETSDASFKKQVCYVVCHELAHMWFGDLVTMKWWDELWLNEGFATWVGYIAVDYLFPEWNILNMVTHESLQVSLTLDGLRSSHPIHVPVVDAVDVDQIFDAISYHKGCSIIAMLSNYIGKEVFLKGVAKYLQENQFGNGSTANLWDAVGEVSGKPISSMMNHWVTKIGFPLINVELNGKDLVLTQSRFLSTGDVKEEDDTTVWWVPLNISCGLEDDAIVEDIAVDSFESKRVVIGNFPTGDGFFKLNKNSTGFYRVNYSQEVIDKHILPYMDKLSPRDKIGLFSDVAAVAISGLGSTSTVTLLTLIKSIVDADQLGDDYGVWLGLNEILGKLRVVFSGDEEVCTGIDSFLRFVYRKLGAELLQEVKSNHDLSETDFRKVILITTVFSASGGLGVPEFVEYAKESFETWKNTGKIHPNLTFFIFSTMAGLEDLQQEDFDRIVKEITDPSSLDSREQAVKSLPSISNMKYVEPLLGMLKDTSIVPLMDSHYMAEAFTLNRKTRDRFWSYFKENYGDIHAELATNVPILERFIRFAFVNYQSEEMYKDVEEFFAVKGITGFERSYRQAVDTIKTNNSWYKRDLGVVKQWLSQNGFV